MLLILVSVFLVVAIPMRMPFSLGKSAGLSEFAPFPCEFG